MTRRRVVVEESVSLSLGKYQDWARYWMRLMLSPTTHAQPARCRGGPTMSRLRVGSYRVLYETGETTIWVRRIDRVL